MESIQQLGMIIGGLGLFMLAIGMMTDGLKLAAGKTLRAILSNWSSTPLKGIFSGYVMTAIVQSSSAVTVASLGFVNAGLINMRQALGIVYGANVGTTMTSWLVAIIGFKLDINAFALPLIGIGMLIKMTVTKQQQASIGTTLVGFGLFFIGIDVLKDAFEHIVHAFDITQYSAEGVKGVLTFLLIGCVMTILTQSSSASIALTITAASSGIFSSYAAAAMVIGANIGTTSTAVFAAIGATSNAKRVAAAQVIFNLITAIVALMSLPLIFYGIESIAQLLSFTPDIAVSLALFHTIFNILGVLLIYPQNERLADFLLTRFIDKEEQEAKPKFIDSTLTQTPSLAVNALVLELRSVSDKISALFRKVIHKRKPAQHSFNLAISAITSLSNAISNFIVKVESRSLTDETSKALAILMRVEQYFLTATIALGLFYEKLTNREAIPQADIEEKVDKFFHEVFEFIDVSRSGENYESSFFQSQLEQLTTEHDILKANLISEATRAQISIAQMSDTLDCMYEAHAIAQHWHKAFTRIRNIEAELRNNQNEE